MPAGSSHQAPATRGLQIALAVAWFAVAALAAVVGRRGAWARPAAPLLAAMGLAAACRVLDRATADVVAASLTATVALLAAMWAMVDLVRVVQDEHAVSGDLTRELVETRTAVTDRDNWRADLAHDARGTLAGIRAAMLSLHRHGDDLDPAAADRLRAATMAELTHLEQMFEHQRADRECFEVTDVVGAVTEIRRAAGMRVDVRLCPARLHGSPAQLATVLQNLLLNAHHHAPGAGVRVGVGVEDTMARIVVADDGPGMPTSTPDFAFGRGSRGADSRGSGLGLSIARELARGQGGEIELLPTRRGSTFVISWPLAESDQPALRQVASVTS